MALDSGALPVALSGNVAKNDFNSAMNQLDAAFPLASVNIAMKACTYLHGAVRQSALTLNAPESGIVLDTGVFTSLACDILIGYFVPKILGVVEVSHNVEFQLYDIVAPMHEFIWDPKVANKYETLCGLAYKEVSAGSQRFYLNCSISGSESISFDCSAANPAWIVAVELRR